MTTALAVLGPMEAQSLPALLLPLISFETSSITGSDGQFDGVKVTRCTIARDAPEEVIRDGLAAIYAQLRPCGGEFAVQQLALLKARTKSRPDADQALTAAAYGDWLAEYPADVAKAACEEWARGMVFWPAWADLQRICDRLVSKRIAIRRALQAALEPKVNQIYLGKRAPETRAQRLQASRDAWLKHGVTDRAARIELMLAKETGRAPEEWAKPVEQKIEKPDPTTIQAEIAAIFARKPTPDQQRTMEAIKLSKEASTS